MSEHRIELDTGVLELRVQRAEQSLESLCGFAARDNSKRGFLFVSKVLGKHWPARPSRMGEIHAQLAAWLDLNSEPWVFIAMAETATGLGQGVFEAFLARQPAAGALFLHSTRYRVGDNAPLDFQEPHCHAPEQLLYTPLEPQARACFHQARELVLIDDEISTGTTLCNLVAAYRHHNPQLERVHVLAITDFSHMAQAAMDWETRLGLPVHCHALLKAEYHFTPAAHVQPAQVPVAVGDNHRRPDQLARTSGRFGLMAPIQVPTADIQALSAHLAPHARVLVLGTGEYMHLAFRIGQHLEAQGFDTWVQATTRSPIRLGADIRQKVVFADNYGEGIANYLYNVVPEDFDRIIICHETPVEDLASLVHNLGSACVTYRLAESPNCKFDAEDCPWPSR